MKLSILIVFLSIVYVTSITLDEIHFTPIREEIAFAPTKYHRQPRNDNTKRIEDLYAPKYETDEIRYKRQSNEMMVEDNHTYYLSTFYPSESGVFNELWIDLTLNTSHHVVLSNTYLKYINIDFDLPFYGHLVSQVSITTAGFLSIFNTPHPYIHLTQYIAPFSADFNPSQNSESKIYYQIDEDRIIVLWEKVTLNGRPEIGFFTFETIVYKNGKILFLYKDIPALLNETSAMNYTSLIGVADAFLVELVDVNVIYTYHRVRLGEGLMLEGTVFQLDPVPNCVVADSWESCRNISCYSSFSCGWCSKVKKMF
ncbi:Plexin domain-containing protein 1 isoform X2 [Oopsacas minuta]|uniref:Plexin domain-containing protein 1 isoform X2 n=1 Tax=Oopsacas minuta TaxID=111878 RepID=A0AAV7JU98_9METZ|nr:Plexin domain-containing protein 1 isoform X2 [Oopsacas minuta]